MQWNAQRCSSVQGIAVGVLLAPSTILQPLSKFITLKFNGIFFFYIYKTQPFIPKQAFILIFKPSWGQILCPFSGLHFKLLLRILGDERICFYCQKKRGWNTWLGACSYIDATHLLARLGNNGLILSKSSGMYFKSITFILKYLVHFEIRHV